MRLAWVFFLFISFWPWEKDAGEIKKTSLAIPSDRSLLKVVRVALFYEKSKVSIETPGPYEIKEWPGNESLIQGALLAPTAVRADASGIRVGAALYKVSGLRITSRRREVHIGNQKYHDAITLVKNPSGTLTVVNEIDVEDYLKGVLPSEMNPTWPEEALKAQAVVSRTYAIFKNIENKDFPFALSSNVESQVYGGKGVETSLSNRAVEMTHGEILTYRGKIFPAFFHSTCGGRTTRADYQWKVEAHPCLKGVECPFCIGTQYYAWRAEWSRAEIQNLLARKWKSISEIQNIRLQDIDDSGRPRFFAIEHAGGSLKVSANEFRLALGPDRMRSTKVTIEIKGDNFLFKGKGWGHGVGLCQYGAKHLAELGYRYTDILRYYYPDSEIRNLDDYASLGGRSGASMTEGEEQGGGGNIFKRWFQKAKSYAEDL